MIKAVIIDDEKKAREFIELILQRNFPHIMICGKANSVVEGIKLVNSKKPDIVFLDIEMQDGTGFDLLDAIQDKSFDFIFVTAYNQYAIKAFKYSAVDYVIKPINIEDFTSAIKKILKKRTAAKSSHTSYDLLKSNIYSKNPVKIAIPVTQGTEYIVTSNVVSFNADGRYTRIFLTDGRKLTISRSLGEFNDLIDNQIFFKPHKSYIVNLNHVKMHVKKGNYLLMSNESEIPLARANRESFNIAMLNLNKN
ncbi:MAG: DNA-binding response regulator [Marinilabiliales bacterium]|nr:MAG: DNA-binding response regulator [Marinilabiliales bacterium]